MAKYLSSLFLKDLIEMLKKQKIKKDQKKYVKIFATPKVVRNFSKNIWQHFSNGRRDIIFVLERGEESDQN